MPSTGLPITRHFADRSPNSPANLLGLVDFPHSRPTLSVPTQVSIRKIKVNAMRLQKRNTYDSFDSWEHVCGRRWHEQNRNVSISFAHENVWKYHLFRVDTTTHGHIDDVAPRS